MDSQTHYVVELEAKTSAAVSEPVEAKSWLVELTDPVGSSEQLCERAIDIFHEQIGLKGAEHDRYDIGARVARADEVLDPVSAGFAGCLTGDGNAADIDPSADILFAP